MALGQILQRRFGLFEREYLVDHRLDALSLEQGADFGELSPIGVNEHDFGKQFLLLEQYLAHPER